MDYNKDMIVIYTSPGCASCRKVRTYMKEHNLQYKEKNIFNTMLSEKEIKYLLSRTENGSDDLISKRSKIIQENKIDIESMTTDELIKFIVQNPSVLKRPIIIDDQNLQFGYDAEEIQTFRPSQIRDAVGGCESGCPHYETCGKVRE